MIGKKILVVARSTRGHQLAGGMESSYEQIVRGLVSSGARVSLLTTHGIVSPENIPTYERIWEIQGGTAGKYSLNWWIGTLFHHESIEQWNPDLIFSVSSAAGSMVFRPKIAAKTFAQCHGTALSEVRSSISTNSIREWAKVPLNLLRVIREVSTYRRCREVIAIGPSVYDQLKSLPFKLSANKAVLINNGIDESTWFYAGGLRREFRRNLNIDDNSLVGIFVARLHRQKGADIAIKALSLVDRSLDVHLIVCGAGPAKDSLVTLAMELGISSRVHFVGQLASTELSVAMTGADVFVFPTRRREGLPLNILEALANGLAVLTVTNANVPVEFNARVKILPCNAEAFATEFCQVPRNSSRDSLLTSEFTMQYSSKRYIDRIGIMLSKIGKDCK